MCVCVHPIYPITVVWWHQGLLVTGIDLAISAFFMKALLPWNVTFDLSPPRSAFNVSRGNARSVVITSSVDPGGGPTDDVCLLMIGVVRGNHRSAPAFERGQSSPAYRSFLPNFYSRLHTSDSNALQEGSVFNRFSSPRWVPLPARTYVNRSRVWLAFIRAIDDFFFPILSFTLHPVAASLPCLSR